MAESFAVVIPGRGEIKELVFDTTPRIGETVVIPDKSHNDAYTVEQVIHYAMLPHSNEVARTTIILSAPHPRYR